MRFTWLHFSNFPWTKFAFNLFWSQQKSARIFQHFTSCQLRLFLFDNHVWRSQKVVWQQILEVKKSQSDFLADLKHAWSVKDK